jgi:hypothetical protein
MAEKYYDEISGSFLNVRDDAFIFSGLFEDSYFNDLKNYLLEMKEKKIKFTYDTGFGRTTLHSNSLDDSSLLIQSHDKLVPLARELFKNNNIEKSYCIYSVYKGYKARLYKHIDDNACSYTIDLMVHYGENWPIVVEGKELCPDENEAVIYYGEDQYHWRPRFPKPETNEVGVIFYHFVDKDHWFFDKSKDTLSEIIDRRSERRMAYGLINSYDNLM